MSPKRQTLDAPIYYMHLHPLDLQSFHQVWANLPFTVLIKVKEAFQIKLMKADEGPLPWLSVDLNIQNRLNMPGGSRFEVSVYPPPGQTIHTLTPACQRREQ